jgi:eukaryotic-like serine/threonine-protein kinase
MAQQQSRIGQQMGHYHLIRLLCSGGFADVYLSEHIHLHTLAAVKILHTRLADTDIEAFRREAQTVAFLQHPSIVRVLDFGVEHNIPYLAMDYAPNGSLRNRYPKGTVVSVPAVTPILMQIASALQYAHDHRLIHRDIKPENMLLGPNFEVLLGDFGIALVTQSSHMQSTQNIAGTIAYMAPEQIQAHPRPASDQYALGIVVYEWLCGQRPFQGSYTEIAVKHALTPPPPLRTQIPYLPTAIEQVVMKALQKDPEQRFANVITFAQTFAQVAQSVTPPPQSSLSTLQTPFTSLANSMSRPAQFIHPVLTPPNPNLSNSTTGPALGTSSLTQPRQSNITATPTYTPHYLTQGQSYSTFMPSQIATPVPPQQPPTHNHKPSTLSRRTFIGGTIAGIAITGGIGAWLYFQRSPATQLPGITTITGPGSPVNNTGTNTPILTYTGHHSIVYSISWSPDGTYIASGSQDGECQVWTAAKGTLTFLTHTTLQPPISDDFVQSLAWSRHDPPRVAIGFIDGTLQILDINNRQRIGSLNQGYTTNGILSWSPDEKYLAVCKGIIDHAVVIYEVATWNIIYTYQDHTDSVHVVAWSPDGQYIASGSKDTTIRIWEPLSGQTRLIYKEHHGDIAALSWSNDSTKIVSSAQDYVVQTWETATGNTLHTHQYPSQAPMGKVAWSHNNKLIAAYPGTGSVDILDEQLAIKQTIQAGATYDFSWSPDDTRLATANYDNIAQVWGIGS